MFVRKKKNRSGTTSVVVVDKSGGRYRELKTIGVSSDEKEITVLYHEGKKWIDLHCGNRDMFSKATREREEKQVTAYLLDNVDNILINGPRLILDEIFKLVGFDAIDDDILQHLVIARLCQPSSKAGTVDYLKSYFETDNSDELRERGFSKDGKHAQRQVVLGLLVSRDGYPLAYSIFNGSQYEGRTMIPLVEDFVRRFNLKDFVVVADSGLMNKTNIALLESGNYKYIIGARIKNEGAEIKQWLLSLEKQDGSSGRGSLCTIQWVVGDRTRLSHHQGHYRIETHVPFYSKTH